MGKKIKEGAPTGEPQYRDMDDYARLSPNVQKLYDLCGGIEGIERALKSDNPRARDGANALMFEILRDLSTH